MGDVKDDVASLFPSINQPVAEVKSDNVLDLTAQPAEPVNSVAGASTELTDAVEEKLIEEAVSEYNQIHDRLLEELAVLRGDRTEDNIGLDENYWKKLNELRMHIHNNK